MEEVVFSGLLSTFGGSPVALNEPERLGGVSGEDDSFPVVDIEFLFFFFVASVEAK